MPNIVSVKQKKEVGKHLENALKVGISTALIGVGSAPSGFFGAMGSLGLGAVSCKYIVPEGAYNYVVAGFSILNAVDLLMEGITARGVIG